MSTDKFSRRQLLGGFVTGMIAWLGWRSPRHRYPNSGAEPIPPPHYLFLRPRGWREPIHRHPRLR